MGVTLGNNPNIVTWVHVQTQNLGFQSISICNIHVGCALKMSKNDWTCAFFFSRVYNSLGTTHHWQHILRFLPQEVSTQFLEMTPLIVYDGVGLWLSVGFQNMWSNATIIAVVSISHLYISDSQSLSKWLSFISDAELQQPTGIRSYNIYHGWIISCPC